MFFSNTCWTQLLAPLEILMNKISLKYIPIQIHNFEYSRVIMNIKLSSHGFLLHININRRENNDWLNCTELPWLYISSVACAHISQHYWFVLEHVTHLKWIHGVYNTHTHTHTRRQRELSHDLLNLISFQYHMLLFMLISYFGIITAILVFINIFINNFSA